MLNRYNEISLSDVRERAKMSLRLQNTTEQDDFLDVLILEGVRQLNTNYNWKKRSVVLDIEDSKAVLPCGFISLIGLRFYGADGNCQPLWYADQRFVESCDCNDNTNMFSFVQTFFINGKYIYFKSDVEATQCQLAFYGLNVNDNGDLIIYEDYERGVAAYACWKFMMAFHTDYPLNLTMEYKKEWINQKAYLKGSAQVEDFQRNKREIQNIFKSLTVSNLINT